MPINPDYFRPSRCHRIHPLRRFIQAIAAIYHLCMGEITLYQAKCVWTGKARLIVGVTPIQHDPGPPGGRNHEYQKETNNDTDDV